MNLELSPVEDEGCDSKMHKVMTIVGTRPELIKLSMVIKELDKYTNHVLVHTGQNYDYELNQVFFEDLEIRKPNYYLNVAEETVAKTIARIIERADEVMEIEKPNAVLIYGDTNSCLSVIPAKRRKIPIFHMEAGNRCFDQRVPEELNRRIVDQIADINLVYSDLAREHLIREGFPSDRVIKTGSPMYEVLNNKKEEIEKSDILSKLNLKEHQYFVVSAHREENINSENNFNNLIDCLNTIAGIYQLPIIFSTHPRTRKMIELKDVKLHPLIRTEKPFGFIDYIKLQINAKAVLSDSGTISEETSILKLKALNIREAHERPEAMEEATVMMVGLNKKRILQGLKILEAQNKETIRPVNDYIVTNVSDKVLRIIVSYTDYVNRVVWGEN